MLDCSVLALVLGGSSIAAQPPPSEDAAPPAASEPASSPTDEHGDGGPDGVPTPPPEDASVPASPDDGGSTSGSAGDGGQDPGSSSTAPPLYTHDPMVSPPAVSASDHEPPPSRDDEEASKADSFDRHGLFITFGAGVTHCAQEFCSPIPMGGLGRLELGYRLGLVALVGSVSGGGFRTGDPDMAYRSIRTLDAAAGLLLLPVREGPVDPFIGATLGYARSIRVFDEASSTDRQYSSRGALRLSGGVLWHVSQRVALGPRFDVQMPFAGKWCTTFDPDFDPEPQCQSIREEIIVVDDPDKSNARKRSDRRAFPRPWALSLDVRITF